ncbi:hypothetical protein JCM1841_001422 [Sporobolomyces salmonicolor]
MPSASPLRQTTLTCPRTGQLALSNRTPVPSSSFAASPPSSSRSKQPRPIRHAFVDKRKRSRAAQDGYRSAAESISSGESEGEPQLRREKDHVEVGAGDYLFDSEAEDADDYESGDSMDGAGSDEHHVSDHGRSRRSKRRRSSSVEVSTPPPSSSRKRRAVAVESPLSDGESDVVVQDDPPVPATSHNRLPSETASTKPAASTSQHLAVPSNPSSTSVFQSQSQSQAAALPSHARRSHRTGFCSTFEGVIIYTPSPSVSPRAPSKAAASRRFSAGTPAVEEDKPEIDPDSDDDPVPVPASLRSKVKPSAKPKTKRQPKTRQRLAHLSQGVRDRRSADEASGDELEWVVDDEEYGEEKKKRRKRKGKEKAGEVSEENNDEAAQALNEVVVPNKRTGNAEAAAKGKGKGKETAKEKERSKKRRRRRSPSVDEEPDDLEILDEVTVREDKLRARKSTAGRFAALKAARQRKAPSGSQAKPPRMVLDSSDEDEASSRAASASPYPASLSQLRHAHRPSPRFLGDPSHPSSSSSESSSSSDSDRATPDLDDNLEHFIVDEDADNEGQAIVKEFVESVRGKSQGIKYYLKTYLLYLVHLIVCPQVNWLDDPDFKEAQERVHGQLQGMLQSLIGSSAWKPKFQHVMDTRPEMTLVELGADEKGAACDACTMGNSRHSAFIASVGGPKYDRKTLRPIASSDDSSEESSSDADTDSDDEDDSNDTAMNRSKSQSKKRKGRDKKKSRDKVYEFNLGKFCAGRSEVYHTFTHWAFTTRERMSQKLAPLQREVAPAQITEGMSKEERKEEKKREVDRRANEAMRLGGVLEERKVIGEFANRLEKEIQDAIASFSERR